MEKEMIKIMKEDGSIEEVELVTYLISEDETKTFVVYTKGETQGAESDKVIYISKFQKSDDKLVLNEITDDSEWGEVINLLKKIANTK